MNKNLITIVIPTYNEEDNILLIYDRINNIFKNKLLNYDYNLLFCDNKSIDNTRKIIKDLSLNDSRCKYIFNLTNFGFSNSIFYGLTESRGDASILMYADMQDPPEVIPEFIKKWEEGNKVVIGIKSKSDENALVYFARSLYYYFIDNTSKINHISQYDGFGLYDNSVIRVLKSLDDKSPYLRGIIAELYNNAARVNYHQAKRNNGKSKFNFFGLYDLAMLGITNYSTIPLRICVFFGALIALCSFLIAIVTVILKLLNIITYPVGTAATLFGIFFLGGIQLLFIGVLGEYVLRINTRTIGRPIVIEEERNF